MHSHLCLSGGLGFLGGRVNFPLLWIGAEFLIIVTYVSFSQADIMDINEIFKDLGMMIHEQGDVIGKPRWGGSRLHAVYLL